MRRSCLAPITTRISRRIHILISTPANRLVNESFILV